MADDIKEPRSRYGWAWAIITIGMFLGLVFWVFNLGDELSDTPPAVEDQMTSAGNNDRYHAGPDRREGDRNDRSG